MAYGQPGQPSHIGNPHDGYLNPYGRVDDHPHHVTGWWLSHLKNMSSSVGMMTFPTVSGKS